MILGLHWYVLLILTGIFILSLYACDKMTQEQKKIGDYDKILEKEENDASFK